MAAALIHWCDAMVELTIYEDRLILHVKGADRLWAFKSTLEIPLRHVSGV